jgi:Domain of unknown function (DUF1996)
MKKLLFISTVLLNGCIKLVEQDSFDAQTVPTPIEAGTAPDATPHHTMEAGHEQPEAGDIHDASHTDHVMPEASVDPTLYPQGVQGSAAELVQPTDEAPAAGGNMGFARTVCGYSHMSQNDPIVFPGKEGASHLHTFFGNTSVDHNSTVDSLKTNRISTCRGGSINASAYWSPTLMDAEGKPVAPLVNLVYYKHSYQDRTRTDTKPIPEGLIMIAGSAKSSGEQEHVFWSCRNTGAHFPSIPSCGTGEQFQLTVMFPNCWDGVNLDSTDHISHMAYANGGCPGSHPVALPEITYNIIYVEKPDHNDGYRLASDMYSNTLPGGMSGHADYIALWKKEAIESLVNNCLNKHLDCHAHLLGNGTMIFSNGEQSF